MKERERTEKKIQFAINSILKIWYTKNFRCFDAFIWKISHIAICFRFADESEKYTKNSNSTKTIPAKKYIRKASKFFKFWTGVEMDYIHFPVFETFCINIVHVRFKKFSTMKVLKIK